MEHCHGDAQEERGNGSAASSVANLHTKFTSELCKNMCTFTTLNNFYIITVKLL